MHRFYTNKKRKEKSKVLMLRNGGILWQRFFFLFNLCYKNKITMKPKAYYLGNQRIWKIELYCSWQSTRQAKGEDAHKGKIAQIFFSSSFSKPESPISTFCSPEVNDWRNVDVQCICHKRSREAAYSDINLLLTQQLEIPAFRKTKSHLCHSEINATK